MAENKNLTSNGQGTKDTKPKVNAKDPKPATPAKSAAPKTEVKTEAKADPNKKEVLRIDDISSPSLEVFNLKQKGKIHLVLKRADLEERGFPVYDAAQYDKRNMYTNHVKHVLMNALKDGKITTLRHEFRYDEAAKVFPDVKVFPPAPKAEKKTATSSTSKSFTPDPPVELDGLKYDA